MSNVVKWIAILFGSIILGGFLGWLFNMAGVETAVAVAVIIICVSIIDSVIKKMKKGSNE